MELHHRLPRRTDADDADILFLHAHYFKVVCIQRWSLGDVLCIRKVLALGKLSVFKGVQ